VTPERTERIIHNPKTGECCVIVPGKLGSLDANDEVVWDARQCAKDLRIQFMDDQAFGVTSIDLPAGQIAEATVQANAPTMTQNYQIIIIETQGTIKTELGFEPTIIIGD